MRSMNMINDPGFHRLMKTGHPHYQIPSSRTVAPDVHVVFRRVKERIAKMLQVCIYYILVLDDSEIFLPSKRHMMGV